MFEPFQYCQAMQAIYIYITLTLINYACTSQNWFCKIFEFKVLWNLTRLKLSY